MFAGVLVFFKIQFVTNDDVRMMLWSAGISQVKHPTEFLLFMHIFMGKILNTFYELSVSIPWYTLHFIVCLWIAFVNIYRILLKIHSTKVATALYLFLFFVVGMDCIQNLQFTTIAGILCLSGFFGLFSHLRSNRITFTKSWYFYMGLIVWGAMIRLESFLPSFLIFCCICTVLIFSKKIEAKNCIKHLSILISVIFTLYVYQYVAYKRNAAVSEFNSFNGARAELNDYYSLEFLNSDDKKLALNHAQWSENDYNMLMNWLFFDESIFNKTSIDHSLENVHAWNRFNYKNISSTFMHVNLHILLNFVFITLLILFFIQRKGLYIWLGVFFTIGLLAVYSIVFMKPFTDYIWRYIWLFCWAPFFIYRLELPDTKKIKVLSIAMLSMGILISGYTISKYIKQSAQITQNNWWMGYELNQLKSIQNTTFLVFGSALPWEFMDPWMNIEELEDVPIFVFGSAQQTLLAKDILSPKPKNLAELLCDENYTLINNHAAHIRLNLLQTYMREHYQKKMVFQEIHKNDIYGIYKAKCPS